MVWVEIDSNDTQLSNLACDVHGTVDQHSPSEIVSLHRRKNENDLFRGVFTYVIGQNYDRLH